MSEVEETMSVVGYEWSDCSKCKNLFCKKAGTQETVYCNHFFKEVEMNSEKLSEVMNKTLEAELVHAVVELGPKDVISRICTICREMEYPQAQTATKVTWICPECAKKIGKLIGVRTES